MSIRPIDYTNMISKSQEIARMKHEENTRYQMQLRDGFIQQNKRINHNMKKVRDSPKSEGLIVDRDKNDAQNRGGGGDRKKRQHKKRKKRYRARTGTNIDIKI
ncbi:MAG: hypothetical protein GX329_07390 [Tissierellia bacterium]|nr:hypothetical protein [Tissierellia bacterium]